MYNPFSLKTKKILITGASSGIGQATAIECSKMGATVIITGRNKKRLNETFNKLEGDGHAQIVFDFENISGINDFINLIPCINGVVHCAGINDLTPFPFVNEKKLNKIFSTNFFTPVLITKEILKEKKLLKGGSVVFISSVSGPICSCSAGGLYSSTKGAIHGMAKGMALDLAVKKIRVNTVQPGNINTNIFKDGQLSKEQLQEDIKKYPLKRHGEPEEVAYAIIYLLSDASCWVTGSNLLIDGGFTLQ